MRIGIDGRFALRQRRGIGRYTLNLINELSSMDSEHQYIIYVDRDDLEGVLPSRPNFRITKLVPSSYVLWEQLILPYHAKRDALDVLHCTGNTAPLILDKNIILVTTVHDVMFLKARDLLPASSSLYQRLGRMYRFSLIPHVLRRSQRVITVSEFSKQDIKDNFQWLPQKNIQVTYEAYDKLFTTSNGGEFESIRSKLGITKSYIFTLGGLDERKNTERVLQSFNQLRRGCSLELQLVVGGIPSWKNTRFNEISTKLEYGHDVIFTDFLTETELITLYKNALMFLYPSLYEGFGLPPLEAMSCGVPVVSSNVTSIPEIVADAALLVDPRNVKELSDAMHQIITNLSLRNELIERGYVRSKEFSWVKMAEETLSVYDAAVSDFK